MSKTKTDELLQAAWAKALYEAWARHGETPLFDALAAEMGNPLAVERLAS